MDIQEARAIFTEKYGAPYQHVNMKRITHSLKYKSSKNHINKYFYLIQTIVKSVLFKTRFIVNSLQLKQFKNNSFDPTHQERTISSKCFNILWTFKNANIN